MIPKLNRPVKVIKDEKNIVRVYVRLYTDGKKYWLRFGGRTALNVLANVTDGLNDLGSVSLSDSDLKGKGARLRLGENPSWKSIKVIAQFSGGLQIFHLIKGQAIDTRTLFEQDPAGMMLKDDQQAN